MLIECYLVFQFGMSTNNTVKPRCSAQGVIEANYSKHSGFSTSWDEPLSYLADNPYLGSWLERWSKENEKARRFDHPEDRCISAEFLCGGNNR